MNSLTDQAGIIILVAVAGTGTFLVQQSRTAQAQSEPVAAAPSATVTALPIKFANDAFAGKSDDQFLNGIDPQTKRTNGSDPAGHIKSLIDPAGPDFPDYLRVRAARLVRLDVKRESLLSSAPFPKRRSVSTPASTSTARANSGSTWNRSSRRSWTRAIPLR